MRFQQRIEIHASPETIWGLVGSADRWPEWFPGMTGFDLPDGPDAAGRRRVMKAGPLPLAEVISHHEPLRRYGYQVRNPLVRRHQGMIELEPLPGGRVRVTYWTEIETKLPIVGKLVGAGAAAAVNAAVGPALKKLKRIAER